MHVVVTVPPDALLDAATVRARLAIDDTIDDDTLNALVSAATEAVDGPGGWLGRALGQQTLQLSASHFPELWERWRCDQHGVEGIAGDVALHWQAIKLPYPPVQSVGSVTYLDASGTRQTLDPSTYGLSGRLLSPAPNLSWPSGLAQPGAVQITYVAGYAAGKVPARAVQAILLAVSKLRSMTGSGAFLKSDAVTGVGSQTYQTATEFGAAYDQTAAALLSTLRVMD